MDLDFIWVSAAGLGTGSIAGILLFLAFRLRKKPEMMTGQYNTSFVFSGNRSRPISLMPSSFWRSEEREVSCISTVGGAKDI
jgi:hypothetical protein